MVSAPQPQILSQVPASTSSQAVTIPLPGGITVSVTVPTHLTQPRGPPINTALKGVKVRIEKVVIKRGEVEKK